MSDIGQVAYEGYYTATNGKSLVTGSDIPGWDKLPDDIKDAWHTAAAAVVHETASVPPKEEPSENKWISRARAIISLIRRIK